jgi:N-acetylmuramoyl-L-alanine amidase
MRAKRILAALTAAAVMAPGVYAKAVPVDIAVNENIIKTDAAPVNENGTVLAPVRAVANALGCENVYWDGVSKTAVMKHGSDEIKVTEGKNSALVNGISKKLNAAVRIINDRTFVPVRFIAENFGAEVYWNPKTYTVGITKDGHTVDVSLIDQSYTHHDLEWLAKIVHAEAQGESMSGKIGVANVILNRVESNEFPNTIYDVIFDRKYGIQFTPTANGTIYNEAANESYAAAKKALKGENTIGDSLYFCNPAISTNFWIMNNRPYYMTIGRHDFYL